MQTLVPGEYSLRFSAPNTPYLFRPAVLPLSVVAGRCQESLKPVVAAEGRVVSGQIVPPLAGVVVRMTLEGSAPLEVTSDAKGVYVFPAIDPATQFISLRLKNRWLNDNRWRL